MSLWYFSSAPLTRFRYFPFFSPTVCVIRRFSSSVFTKFWIIRLLSSSVLLSCCCVLWGLSLVYYLCGFVLLSFTSSFDYFSAAFMISFLGLNFICFF